MGGFSYNLLMDSTNQNMNSLFHSTGKDIRVPTALGMDEGSSGYVIRRVNDVRICYGASIELRLDRPLPGFTSCLFTVDAGTAEKIQIEK